MPREPPLRVVLALGVPIPSALRALRGGLGQQQPPQEPAAGKRRRRQSQSEPEVDAVAIRGRHAMPGQDSHCQSPEQAVLPDPAQTQRALNRRSSNALDLCRERQFVIQGNHGREEASSERHQEDRRPSPCGNLPGTIETATGLW